MSLILTFIHLLSRIFKLNLTQSLPFMKISKESIAILRDKLPRGSAQKIRARLKKNNIRFTQQYIYRCLDPDHLDYNHLIIEEAIKFGEEIAIQKNELLQRIELLEKTI